MISRRGRDLPPPLFGTILSGGDFPGTAAAGPGYHPDCASGPLRHTDSNHPESLRMRRIPLIVLALPVLLLAGVASAQSIKLDPTAIDLGTMKQMDTRTVKVKVTNMGAGLLVIEDVHADCGCTVPELKVKSLKAGESTDLVVNFDSKQFNGQVHKTVKITSNDPDRRTVDLPLTANVKAVLIVDPVSERVGFPSSLKGEVASRTVTFTAPEVNLKLQADKTQKGLFDIKITNGADGDPHKSVLEVIRPARMGSGQHQDVVRLATNIPERPTIDIEMRAIIAAALSASPDVVNFRYQPSFTQTVRIFAAKPPMDFKVLRAEIDLPEVKFEIVEAVPRQETHIKLTGAPIAKTDPRAASSQGRITGTLKVYTDLKAVPVIEVPVSYMIRM
jgi:hypothetical protein